MVGIWDVRGMLSSASDSPDLLSRLTGHTAAALSAVGLILLQCDAVGVTVGVAVGVAACVAACVAVCVAV